MSLTYSHQIVNGVIIVDAKYERLNFLTQNISTFLPSMWFSENARPLELLILNPG